MPRIVNLTLLFVVFCLSASPVHGQVNEPLEAVLKSLRWLEVLDSSHDVEITAHRGSKAMVKGASDRDQFGEGIIKIRQIYDDESGDFFIAYAMGTISIHGIEDPKEYSDVRVRYGGKDWVKESKKGNIPMQFGACPKDDLSCRDMVSPVNFTAFAACCGTIDWQSRKNDVKEIVERFSSLKDDSVSVSEQLSNRRKQDVYRITATAATGGLGIPVNKLVVSNEGFDKGLIVEYRGGGIEFGETKYTDDTQLMKIFDCSNTIVWKEFEVRDKKIGTKKVVLPVSLSRKIQSSPYQQYLNVTFDWKSLQSPKPEVMNLQYCEKLCEEFEAKVNQTLRR